MSDEYCKNIFINCPYDSDYREKVMAIIFTVLFLGFNPRMSIESLDSSDNRLNKIAVLIRESSSSIHDLSRMKSEKKKEIFRLNMPFELGFDYGCKIFSDEKHATKKILILEKEQYLAKQAISDINGFDIECHHDDVYKAITHVRNWIQNCNNLKNIVAPNKIWYIYTEVFMTWYLKRMTIDLGYDEGEYLEHVQICEYIDYIKEWLLVVEKKQVQ